MRTWIACVLLITVLIPSLFGGLTYVWCAPMERAMLRSCCPSSHAREHVVEQPCCESQRVNALAAFSLDVAPTPWIAPLPFVALLALAWLFGAGLAPKPAYALAYARRARAGPAPPLFLLHRNLRN
jgi:hypothetical protein